MEHTDEPPSCLYRTHFSAMPEEREEGVRQLDEVVGMFR